MQTVLIVLRLALAGVFVTAGVGKLLDRDGSQTALADFGVPAWLTGPGAVALPLGELAVAAGLVIAPSAQWAGIAGVVLLIAFIAGIAGALARGTAPDCHCFGQIHSSPAGRGTLIRNAVLAVLAGVVAVGGPGPAIDTWVSAAGWHWGVLGGLVALAAAVLLLTRRSDALKRERELEQAARPPGLPIGSPAPEFEVSDLAGGSVTLGSLLASGTSALLVFTHSGCGACGELYPHLARWQSALADRLAVAVLTGGDEVENKLLFSQHQMPHLYLQQGMNVYETYKMRATPSAVLVAADGRIEGATVQGGFAIEQLIRQALRRTALKPHRDRDISAFVSASRVAAGLEDPAPA